MFLIQVAILIIVTGGFLYVAHIDHMRKMDKKEEEHRAYIEKMDAAHRKRESDWRSKGGWD